MVPRLINIRLSDIVETFRAPSSSDLAGLTRRDKARRFPDQNGGFGAPAVQRSRDSSGGDNIAFMDGKRLAPSRFPATILAQGFLTTHGSAKRARAGSPSMHF